MTGLRTKWGCDLEKLQKQYEFDLYQLHRSYVDQLLAERRAVMQGSCLILTNEGRLLADGIAETLFLMNPE